MMTYQGQAYSLVLDTWCAEKATKGSKSANDTADCMRVFASYGKPSEEHWLMLRNYLIATAPSVTHGAKQRIRMALGIPLRSLAYWEAREIES